MNAVKSSSPNLSLLAEGIYVGALALIDAVSLQAWLVGPVWPAGWFILGLAAIQLLTWGAVRWGTEGLAGRRMSLAVSLVAVAAFTVARGSAGSWATILGLAAAALMAQRGTSAASDRPDPSAAFRRISVAFVLTGLALYVHRSPQSVALALVAGLLIACGASLAAARWLEVSARRGGVGGLTVVRASGQLVAIALALVAAIVTALTPRVLAAIVLRPLNWLVDGLARLVTWALQPLGHLIEYILMKIRARATPEVVDIMERMLGNGGQDAEQQQTTFALAETVGRYLSVALLIALAIIAYRALSAALAKGRAANAAIGGTVTVTRLAAIAADARRRKAVTRRNTAEALDGSPAGQVRFIYGKTLRDAAGFGVVRAASETPAAYAARLTASGAAPGDVTALTDAYEEVRYGGERPSRAVVVAVRTAAERVVAAIGAATRSAK